MFLVAGGRGRGAYKQETYNRDFTVLGRQSYCTRKLRKCCPHHVCIVLKSKKLTATGRVLCCIIANCNEKHIDLHVTSSSQVQTMHHYAFLLHDGLYCIRSHLHNFHQLHLYLETSLWSLTLFHNM